MISLQAHIEIAVQPPPTVGVNRRLVPPVVARTRDPQLLEDYRAGSRHLFATAMLYASNMDDYTSALGGDWSVSARLVDEAPGAPSPAGCGLGGGGGGGGSGGGGGGGAQWLYFVFDTVSVAAEGLFALNIVVSALSLSSPGRAGASEVVGGRATRQFSVVAQPPFHAGRPGSSERQVLRQLEAAGLYTPPRA